MKTIVSVFVLLLGLTSPAWMQDRPANLKFRFGQDVDLERYPQKTPHDAVQSALKAIYDQRFDYLLAQIAEPSYVDGKVDAYREALPGKNEAAKTTQAFQKLVKVTTDFYFEDAERIAELRLFGKEAEWKIEGDHATGTHKKIAGRQVFLSRIEGRWFLENRQTKE